jgi:hypothetical protein
LRGLRLSASCALATAISMHAVPAVAANGVPVGFSFEGCSESLAPEVERIARIELHAATERGGAPTQVGLVCDGDEARLTVDDPLTGKRVDRTVSLASVPPPGRARLLALALAELVRSSWIELDLEPSPVLPLARPEPVTVEDKEQARRVAIAAQRTSPWRAYAALEGLYAPTVGRPVLGLSLGAAYEIARPFFVDAGISAWDGATERSTGAVTVRQIAFDPSVGIALPVVEVALGVRIGWASLTGSPSEAGLRGGTTAGFVFGPLLAASARIVGPLRLWLRTGWLLESARGTVAGDSDVVVGGYWVSLGLGLRLGG